MTDLHTPGAKDDASKTRPSLTIDDFAMAQMAIAEVGTYGANKYSDCGWKYVPDAYRRYTDAGHRHRLVRASGEKRDPESGLLHLAHAAWNAMAVLQIELEHDYNQRDA